MKRVFIGKKQAYFLIKFWVFFLLAEAVLNYFGVHWLQEKIAYFVGKTLGIEQKGYFLFVNDGIFEINASCSGLVGASILGALVFSLKKPSFKKKVFIFLAGSLLLVFLNFFRVLGVVWVGSAYGISVAEFVHVVSWFATTFFVLTIWYYFTKKITNTKDFSGFI